MNDTETRINALFEPKLRDELVANLTAKRIRDWLTGLAKASPRLRTRKGATKRRVQKFDDSDPDSVRRRRATANRVLHILKAASKKPANPQRAPAKPTAKPASKLGRLEATLRRPDEATIEQLSKALDWQAHSVRGAMSGAEEEAGLSVASEKRDDGTPASDPDHLCRLLQRTENPPILDQR